MLKTLADKYGISTNEETWEVNLFNQLCLSVELDREMKEQADFYNDLINRQTKTLCEMKKYKTLVDKLLAGDKDIISVREIRAKLAMMDESEPLAN